MTTAHIPGKLNVEADSRTKTFYDRTEWKLETKIFHNVCKKVFMPNIDLFASRLNYQLKLFVSWGPDPEASITFPAEGCTMFWKEKLTNSRPTYHQRAEEIPKYTDDRLCGVRCLEEIHSRTALQYYSK